jgi:glycosyltransferase involved in cell wall biosynthesis
VQLSVILPFYNSAHTIANQLEALASQCWSEPWEVIAVNNRSVDQSRAIVERYQNRLPNLRIVNAFVQQGQAHARNIGAQWACGESLAFCDADDEVSAGWLAAMGEALSKYDFVACRFDFAKLNPPWMRGSLRKTQEYGLQKASYPPYFFHAGGGSLGIRRLIHQEIGGFDEGLLFCEDTDYCFKLQLASIRLHFVQEAVVHVRSRETLRGSFQQARLWAQYQVLVSKRYQQLTGIKAERPWLTYLRHCKGLFLRLPQIRRGEGRAAWIRSLGRQIGRLQGSLKHRSAPF